MKQSEAAEFWPLIKAWGEGKTLQMKNDFGEWMDMQATPFVMPASIYRIKPEPREWYVTVGGDGLAVQIQDSYNKLRHDVHYRGLEIIKVREVLPND